MGASVFLTEAVGKVGSTEYKERKGGGDDGKIEAAEEERKEGKEWAKQQ